MTRNIKTDGKRKVFENIIGALILFFTLLTLFVISVFFSNKLSDYVTEGLCLACEKVVPLVFPTLILTDVALHFSKCCKTNLISRPFARLLGVNNGCVGIFLLGAICGFPTGAKASYDAYKNGIIEKCECERMMALTNNASAPFVIGIVGTSFMGNREIGLLLYFSMVSASIILSHITSENKHISTFPDIILKQKYSFVESVKRAAQLSLNIIAFVSTFYILSKALVALLGDGIATIFILPFIEITASTDYISDLCILSDVQKVVILSFAIGFSGLSAIAQSVAVTSDNDRISIKRILVYKALQGIISALITAFVFTVFF